MLNKLKANKNVTNDTIGRIEWATLFFFKILKELPSAISFSKLFKRIQGSGFWPTALFFNSCWPHFNSLRSVQVTRLEFRISFPSVSELKNCLSCALKGDNNCILGLYSSLSLQKWIRLCTDFFSREEEMFMSTRINVTILDHQHWFKTGAPVQKRNLTMPFFSRLSVFWESVFRNQHSETPESRHRKISSNKFQRSSCYSGTKVTSLL